MHRSFALALIALVAVPLAGRGHDLDLDGKEPATSFEARVHGPARPGGAPGRAVSVVVVYPANQASDYWRRSERTLRLRLEELGLKPKLDAQFTRPGVEIGVQAEQVERTLATRPDYVVFAVDSRRQRALAERILAAPGTRLLLQNTTRIVSEWAPNPPLLYAGFDHRVGGQMIGRWCREHFKGQGRYAVFHGTRGQVSAGRTEGFAVVMAAAPGMRQVDAYHVGFDRDRARRAARDLLVRRPDIDFVYAASTDIALGVADAIGEANLVGKVLVNGWGGGGNELAAMKNGALAVTVMRINDDASVAMAEAIYLDANGRSDEVPQVYSGELAIIDQATSAAALTELQTHAFRYSDAK